MSDDVLVKVDNVSKRFCRSLKRSLWYGMQDLGSEIGGHRHGGGSGLPQSSADVPLRPDEFWAMKDVSFELRRGECLGLIGRNGAGKTTLLRMLNGLIKPDTGRIEMRGQIGALIALGAGFNPVLTGRENIFINGSILGIEKKDLDTKIDEIIEFSEIGAFIDSPVQTYSSGMQARLGFAVSAFLRPDILLVDEVLAVGDIQFRLKCLNKIRDLLDSSSVILVSHNEHDLSRVCNLGIILKDGSKIYQGRILDALDLYANEAQSSYDSCTKNSNMIALDPRIIDVSIESATFLTDARDYTLQVKITANMAADASDMLIRASIKRPSSSRIFAEWKSSYEREQFCLRQGINHVKLTMTNLPIQPGHYFLDIVFADSMDIGYCARTIDSISIVAQGDRLSIADYAVKEALLEISQ